MLLPDTRKTNRRRPNLGALASAWVDSEGGFVGAIACLVSFLASKLYIRQLFLIRRIRSSSTFDESYRACNQILKLQKRAIFSKPSF
jgi:hypothetical protein